MRLQEAETLAISLMNDHELHNWSFNWNNCKQAFGLCRSTKQRIELSTQLIPFMNINEVKNTVLHEIAHALVGVGHHHNHVWRRKAIEIGCDGERTSVVETNIQAKYLAKCPECETTHKAHRRPKKKRCCNCIGYFDNSRTLTYIQQY